VVRRLRSVLLLPLLGVALVATGCGGDDSAVQEVPGPPVTLTVPHQKGAADVSASATPTPTGTATATPTPAAGSTGSTGTTGGTGTNTGAAATPTPAAQDNTAANEAPAADGSPPQQFEQFCEENAGAC
jgi:hypothetical protein